MAGRGPAPKTERRNPSDVPARGEWTPAPGFGWQHGDSPSAPSGLLKASREAWEVWMRAWYAAHWGPEDLPSLRQLIRLYDQVERGEYQRSTELRLAQDTWGITPKGQQDRRWKPPADETPKQVAAKTTERWAHLQVVDKAG